MEETEDRVWETVERRGERLLDKVHGLQNRANRLAEKVGLRSNSKMDRAVVRYPRSAVILSFAMGCALGASVLAIVNGRREESSRLTSEPDRDAVASDVEADELNARAIPDDIGVPSERDSVAL